MLPFGCRTRTNGAALSGGPRMPISIQTWHSWHANTMAARLPLGYLSNRQASVLRRRICAFSKCRSLNADADTLRDLAFTKLNVEVCTV